MQGDHFALAARIRIAIFGHEDAPAVLWRVSCRRNVAADTDQHAAPTDCLLRGVGCEVARQRFSARAEVELHARRQSNGPGAGIELDCLPARDRLETKLERLGEVGQPVEVAVESDEAHRPSDCRVGQPTTEPGSSQGLFDRPHK